MERKEKWRKERTNDDWYKKKNQNERNKNRLLKYSSQWKKNVDRRIEKKKNK